MRSLQHQNPCYSDQVEQEADNLAVSADQLADQVKQFRI